MRVELQARNIPDGSRVNVSFSGAKVYVLKKELQVWDASGKPTKVEANMTDVVFLIAGGQIRAVSGTTDLIWLVGEDELEAYLASRHKDYDTD
jgi:hypothetical protein